MDIFSFLETIWVMVKFKGQLTRFEFAKSSINMYTVESTLNQYGVNVYGRSIRPGGYRTFLVTNKQAKYAEYLCFAANFPKMGTHFPENEDKRGVGLPKRQWEKGGRRKSPFLKFGDILKWF